jgi:hypothetical protein
VLHEWSKGKRREKWKNYVNRRTGISKNFLTRAASNGQLVVPGVGVKG